MTTSIRDTDFCRFMDFVKEINKDNSRTYKMEVLKKYKDDELIKYYLDFVFNPYVTVGISNKKIAQAEEDAASMVFGDKPYNIPTLFEYLKEHNTGRREDAILVARVKFGWTPHYYDLLVSVVTKKLNLGVDVITINKAMGDFIPTFNVQLANKYFDKPEIVKGKEFTLTTKIDGGRIIAIKEDDCCCFYTRAGQVYEGLVDLEKEMMEKIPNGFALDGEITLLDSKGMSSKDQYKATMKITRKDGVKHGVKMKVFDMLPANEFRNQKCTLPYWMRRSNLEEMFEETSFEYFELLPSLYTGSDDAMICKVLQEQVSKGEEGIMINLQDANYQFKRTSDLLKVKLMADVDLQIVGFEEGEGEFKGMLGALVVDYKGNLVNVGSGFTKKQRAEIWDNRDTYLGVTATVQYFEETTNADGGVSLRFPVFIDMRYDK